MKHIRSLQYGIMMEYPVMSTSRGTYVRIEQTYEAIRETHIVSRAGGGGEDWNCEPLVKVKSVRSWSQHTCLEVSTDPEDLDYLCPGVYNWDEAKLYRTLTLQDQDWIPLIKIHDSETRYTMVETELAQTFNFKLI